MSKMGAKNLTGEEGRGEEGPGGGASPHRLEIGEETLPGGGLERLVVEGPVGRRQEGGRRGGLALRVDGVGPALAAVLGDVEVVAEPGGVGGGVLIEAEDQRAVPLVVH